MKQCVSVVMGVFNAGADLLATIDSVLAQDGCEIEFIIVDDGSTDGTGNALADLAQGESRLKVMHQANQGLTKALVRGCEAASGQFIARQDAGDLSLPGRFRRQLEALESDAAAVAVTCATEFVGPCDEPLYTTTISQADLNQGLSASGEGARGPSHHGSVMMRADAYAKAGGYRPQFYFAQDLDLWTRLAEAGPFRVIDDVLYRARLLPASISGTHSPEQRSLASLIAEMTRARRGGNGDAALLEQAASIRPRPRKARPDPRRLAAGNYFIGSCLRERAPAQAQKYFDAAVRHDPLHWRAWIRMLQGRLRSPH